MPDFQIFKGNTKKIFKMFRRDNILLFFVVALAIIIGLIVASSLFFYSNQQKSDVIQPGVFIKNINVSGLTKAEAKALLTQEFRSVMSDNLELLYKNCKYYLELEQFEASFDLDSSIDYALSIAKTGNFWEDMQTYIDVLLLNINIEPVLVYNDEALTFFIEGIQADLPDQLEQSGYYVEDGELIITNGVNGAGIEIDKLKTLIIEAIDDFSYSNSYIQIPTYIQYPEPINVAAIHNDIYVEMQNAYFTTEPYAVFADVTGVDFDKDLMISQIESDPNAIEYKAELVYTKPEITVNDLGMDAFPNLLGSFSTKYDTSNKDRTTNLRLASNKINGTVVMPGEEFSYNKVVGKRTIAAGYKEAAIYADGEVTNGLGGGICQITTTLYNAVIEANMEIMQRRNHMFVPSYSDPGKDATVAWGSTDFVFKNRRDYPIKIESSVSGGIATVKIYGLKTDDEYDINIETKTVKSTSNTLVVDSYRVYRQNGEVVLRKRIYRDTYKKH